jgi:hypothetical protein
VWGFGWSYNFGYALSKRKPVWRRILAFLLGLGLILAIAYVIACIGLIAFYLIEAALTPAEQQLTLAITANGTLVPI